MTETFIALLRGVNVGGANSVTAKDLVGILESLGLKNVKTYIQSGNLVFRGNKAQAASLPEKIKARLQRTRGFAPDVIVLSLSDLQEAIAANPYPKADANPKALHLVFLASAPRTPDLTALDTVRTEGEKYLLKGRIFYFWASEGVGRSKLFSRIEKSLGVVSTARNWRTVCKLDDLARELAAPDQRQPAREKK